MKAVFPRLLELYNVQLLKKKKKKKLITLIKIQKEMKRWQQMLT